MSADSFPTSDSDEILTKPKLSYWRRLGGGSLTISIIVHAIFLAIGVVWVLAVIPPEPEKVVDFTATGGGGSPASSPRQQKQATMIKNLSSRIAAKGASSNFTLPDPESSSNMSSLGSLGGGMGGLGGSGGGTGTGIGSGSGPGMGGLGTAGGAANPFGMMNPNAGALVGTLYDFKKTKEGQPTNISVPDHEEQIRKFTGGGWKDRDLAKYYQAKNKVYQTKVYIPRMEANAAPAAFNAQAEVQPSRWLVIYRGSVTPPKTGRYRFVGAADDVLVVRFANKTVLDHGLTNGFPKDDKNYPMADPVVAYAYTNTTGYNSRIGGLGVGATFNAKEGTAYPIEILISECPGGQFSGSLFIEEVGEKYEKDSMAGSPILPIFRLDGNLPKVTTGPDAPPFDPNGPVWKLVQSGSRPEF